MKLLFALPYGPTVTRVRSRMILEHLVPYHDVTVVALAWNEADVEALNLWRDRCAAVHIIEHAPIRARHSIRGALYEPLQYSVSRSPQFAAVSRNVIALAAAQGSPFDAIHVEHMRGAAALDLLGLGNVHTVFDSVDCLSELAKLTRTHGPNPLVRSLAAIEHPRTRRMEAKLAAHAGAITVVAERDRLAMQSLCDGKQIAVVPNGVQALSRPAGPVAEPTAVFTGKLSYHANLAAARWLVAEIWPQVRNLVPDARLIIAGADPPSWLTKRNGHNGITIVANPPDMTGIIASARVALAPVVYSVGIQNKVLEAMATGTPVVATSSAVEGLLPEYRSTVARADDAFQFAWGAAYLLTDDTAAQRLGIAGYEYVSRMHAWPAVVRQFEHLYRERFEVERAA